MNDSNIVDIPRLILGKVLQYCGHGQIMGLYNASHRLRVRIRESQFFPIYPNQISAAEEVVHNFKKGVRYGVVTAETQSGKTGTCQASCYLIRDIGKELGVTAERIRQVEAKGLRMLRHPSRRRKLESFIKDKSHA